MSILQALIAPLCTQTPVSLKRAGSSASNQCNVHAQPTASDALKDISRAVDCFGEQFKKAADSLCPPSSRDNLASSPSRRMAAISQVDREQWLTRRNRIELIDIFEDTKKVDTYMSISSSPDHQYWIARQLRIEPPPEDDDVFDFDLIPNQFVVIILNLVS